MKSLLKETQKDVAKHYARKIDLAGLAELEAIDKKKEEFDVLPAREKHKIWYASPSVDRWKIRSKTYMGIAQAIANQWGELDND